MGKRLVHTKTDRNGLVTVDELVKELDDTTKVAIYNRIRHGVLVVAGLERQQKLLDPRYSRIRYNAAEEIRKRKAYSLERIGGLLQQMKADALIRQNLESGKSEKAIVSMLADKISE